MTRTLPLAIVSALFLASAARAQSTPQPAPPPAKPYDTLDSDPAFKRLPPEEQAWMRQEMDKLKKAVAEKDIDAVTQIQLDITEHYPAPNAAPLPAPPKPVAPPPGCAVLPVKKPRLHIPKAIQDAINKDVKQVGAKTGVNLDPNAPAQAVNDAQKAAPCPPVSTPAQKPANQ